MSDFNITFFEACELLNRSKKSISRLIERDQETNIILKGLQDRVFLLEGVKMSQNRAENEPKEIETTKGHKTQKKSLQANLRALNRQLKQI